MVACVQMHMCGARRTYVCVARHRRKPKRNEIERKVKTEREQILILIITRALCMLHAYQDPPITNEVVYRVLYRGCFLFFFLSSLCHSRVARLMTGAGHRFFYLFEF